MSRAIRKRYFARSRPGMVPHGPSKAALAAATAASTSPGPAAVTSASTSSLDGLTVLNVVPSIESTKRPPTKRP